MVVRRALTTGEPKLDIQFQPGDFIPMSFHAWDGYRGELGMRGAMTNWRWLYLAPAIPKARLIARAAFIGILTMGVLAAVVVKTRASNAGRG